VRQRERQLEPPLFDFSMTLPLIPLLSEVADRLGGSPRIIMLDLDGTLSPIAPRPQDASVPQATRRAIAALASRPGVHVAIVSGRGAADARRIVSVGNLWVIGNHGLELVGPHGEMEVEPQAEAFRVAMAQASRRITASVTHVAGVILEDKVWTLSVHHRLADPAVVPRLRASIEAVGEQFGLRLTEGKGVLELRPPVQHDKGTAVLALARRLGGLVPGTSVIFAGDDNTDEDAFRVLRRHTPDAVTIRVADEDVQTAAEFRLPDPEAVRRFLEWLVADTR
jgi:trehalose-phosphatase